MGHRLAWCSSQEREEAAMRQVHRAGELDDGFDGLQNVSSMYFQVVFLKTYTWPPQNDRIWVRLKQWDPVRS